MSEDAGSPSAPARPLVMISHTGQNTSDQAQSRRMVRAQAARASAAQSRLTRQRNRNERDGSNSSPAPHQGSATPQPQTPAPPAVNFPLQFVPPVTSYHNNIPSPAAHTSVPAVQNRLSDLAQRPLVHWLTTLLNLSVTSVLNGSAAFPLPDPSLRGVTNSLAAVGSASTGIASGLFRNAGDLGGFKLPTMLPRGFNELQQRIQVSETMIDLLSRTNCIDMDSPGVEYRLHQLLFDIILKSAGTIISPMPYTGHPIQGHLRVACTCLTIFQGQRSNGAPFANDLKYKHGLDAAWSELTLLDQAALADRNAATASLWAMFIISVTTGATGQFFSQQLNNLFHELQLNYWEQVRTILLGFIYPVSFLDEPCKSFYHTVQSGIQPGVASAAA